MKITVAWMHENTSD